MIARHRPSKSPAVGTRGVMPRDALRDIVLMQSNG
jgi:hypothetical protein